jgi:predicted transcriptional regulator
MRQTRLIEVRADGRWRVYRLTDEGRDLLRAVETLVGGR